MKRISARYLLTLTTEQLWDTLVGKFLLVFDDGEVIETNYRETCYTSHFWDFHREYPNTPLLAKHHVASVLKGKMLSSRTHIDLLERVFWDVVDTYGLHNPLLRDPLVRKIYEITNRCYVDMQKRAEAFVVSIDILDFIEVTEHNVVKDQLTYLERKEYQPTVEDAQDARVKIDKVYKDLLNILEKDPKLEQNALARAVRAKMVSSNQVLQCVGPRGFMTEVDGVLLPVPVTRSYTAGMRTLHNIIAESRSAAKSLYFSEAPLEDAEYFARRLQLMCMTVERVYPGDCGSNDYVHWRIKPPAPGYKGDLSFMEGKYYLDETTNTLKVLKITDTHLEDKVIKLRSSIKCKHQDKHGVCEVCFGKLHENLSPDANLGHICCATFTRQTSQSVLSIKHYDANSKAEAVVLRGPALRYFKTGQSGNSLLVKEEWKNKNIALVVESAEARGLTDILLTDNVTDFNLSRTSGINYMGIYDIEVGPDSMEFANLSQNGRLAMLSYDFLAYLKTQRWKVDSKQNFVFDLKNWNFTKPILLLPEMEYSYQQHSSQVAKMIESRVDQISERQKPGSADATLIELFDIVNSKLNVHLSNIEVIVYAIMAADVANDVFDLSRNCPTGALSVSEITMKSRSLAPMYAYNHQHKVMTNPRSFFPENRPDSPMDVFFAPKEVVKAYPWKDRYKGRYD